ncbi:uncharacterized protein EI90DRAFT_3081561 [Cantharellus anzutake]|uniref:uncharacterized protein n=1 Tax=Cantharellus anzutake TaxID=1750568 RepID=UPI001908A888|nr:uncharacterized protein EI90DRAFT_3081561 [Cantharellus anzutake]KAF8319821.1 hypothetical protein EI90DRAFT_3081561 [Cantharellus anzutake]
MRPESIPDDIFIAFGTLLTIDDTFSIRKCGSRHLYWMSLSKVFWIAWIYDNIVKAGLWMPQYLSGLRASPRTVLERLAVRTFRGLRNRWPSRPRCIKNIQCNANSITWVSLYGGRWLFLASSGGTLELWDTHHDLRRQPLDLDSAGGWVCSGLVHPSQTDTDKPLLILSYSNCRSQLLECALGNHSTLTHLMAYEAVSEPLAAHNDFILFATSLLPETLTLARMDGATYTLNSQEAYMQVQNWTRFASLCETGSTARQDSSIYGFVTFSTAKDGNAVDVDITREL